jgi:hypothetical protein
MTYALALEGGGTEARVPAKHVRSKEYAGSRPGGGSRDGGVAAKVRPEVMPALKNKAQWR